MARILIVESDVAVRRFLENLLARDGHQVVSAENGGVLPEEMPAQEYDLALVALEPGDGGGAALAELSLRLPCTPIVVLTTYAALGRALDAPPGVVADCLCKPCKTVEVRESVRAGLLVRQEMQRRHWLAQLERDLAAGLEIIRRITVGTPTGAPGDAHRAG